MSIKAKNAKKNKKKKIKSSTKTYSNITSLVCCPELAINNL